LTKSQKLVFAKDFYVRLFT